MTPIPPAAILNFIQGGYPVDLVLRLAVHSINGIRSRFGVGARMRDADPEFYPLVEKLRNIQQSGEIGMRVEKTGDRLTTSIVFSKKTSPAIEADRGEVRRLLGLDPQADEFNVVYGSVAANDKEIAMLTRSVIEILTDLSSYIDVPAANVEQKRTFPSPAPELANGVPVPPLIRIFSSPQRPDDAFAAVPYGQDVVLDRQQGLSFQETFFFYHVSLKPDGDRREARGTNHNDPRRVRERVEYWKFGIMKFWRVEYGNDAFHFSHKRTWYMNAEKVRLEAALE